MPNGKLKNLAYHFALPLLGQKCQWEPSGTGLEKSLQEAFYHAHTAGACLQRFEKGELTEHFCVGFAGKERPVSRDTIFRTASLAKTVTALLVFRLQTKGLLRVDEDISAFWSGPIRNPRWPQMPITLSMLMNHTSSLCDSVPYFSSFEKSTRLSALLQEETTYLSTQPGTAFRYSNFAAGMIACLLEYRFGKSFETLAQEELFRPLGIRASFDLSTLPPERLADSYRVLPPALAFSAEKRAAAARPISEPDPERHYLLSSGNLFLTAENLANLTLLAWNGRRGFLDEQSLSSLQTPTVDWPEKEIFIRHGPGLFRIEDASVHSEFLWGHQGIAYGAVNGLFFDRNGNGFAVLTSGASEERKAHLTRLNLALIKLLMEASHG